MKPAVLVTRRIPASVLALLESRCDVDLHRGPGPIPGEDLITRVRGKQALVCLLTDRVDRRVLDAAPDLRIIANVAVGYDNVDVASARERGIEVTNTPNVLTEATAEFTWALILAIARRVCEGERVVRSGAWHGWALDFMLGTELRGKQLGIVGMGRIGLAVAVRAPAFGMRVAYTTAGPFPAGSCSYTSSAAPAIRRSRSAHASASSSTTGPRDVFTRNAVRFMRASALPSIRWRVPSSSGTWSVTT